MTVANRQGRAAALKELSETLADAIDNCEDQKLLPQLARQYRETIRELGEIDRPVDDGIESLIGDMERVR